MSAPRPQTHRFSVADFYRMAEAGILRDDQRMELIDGEIKDMMPIGEFHATVVDDLEDLFSEQRQRRFRIRVQNPLKIDEHGLVQPDLILLKRREERSRTEAPGPGDAFLVIEVADSSLAYDKYDKLPRYAQAGIAEVWIVNVPDRQVEVCREPTGLAYGSVAILSSGQSASPAAFPDISIPVAELFR